MQTLLKYLKQPTTWVGLFSILGAFGVSVAPELASEITTAGVALVGVAAVLFNEDKGNE